MQARALGADQPVALPRVAARPSGYEFERLRTPDLSQINSLYLECHPFRPIIEATWLYRQNPWGQPIIWGAFTSTGRLVGMRPAIPWRFFGPGGERVAYQLIDAVVAPDHQGRGLFRHLMRQATEWAAGERIALFSFPNERSLAAYRAGGSMRVFDCCQSRIRVLRWPRFLRARLSERIQGAVTPLGSPAEIVNGDVTLRSIDWFEEDFSDIHAALARRVACFTLRHREFLNWRYTGVPQRCYHIALVEQAGRPQGYVVLRLKQAIAHLVDVFLQPEPDLLARVSRLLVRFATDLRANALCFRASENNPFTQILGRHGVLVKQQVQVVAVDARTMTEFTRSLGDPRPAPGPYFVMGDSDVW